MNKRRSAMLLFATLASLTLMAQQKPQISGDYLGTLGPLHLKLHVTTGPDGAISGTLDSPDQGVRGIPCTDFHLEGDSFRFSVPSVRGSWKGTAGKDGALLSGTWDQGTPLPLNFTRDTFVAASKPSPVDGFWLGTLKAGALSLRGQIKVRSDAAGKEYCTFDSLDQHGLDWECSNVVLTGNDFSFDVPTVRGHWSGKLSADGNALTGVWNQGSPSPLRFDRQAAALSAPPAAHDPAMAPLSVADFEAVLSRDLTAAQAPAFKIGALAPGTGAGAAIGIVKQGVRRVIAFGTAKPDSIFEIGSVTKTFTGLILAQMIAQGKVKLDEPVRDLLPPGTVAKPAGAEITLLDLATQHSGLPRMPDNFNPADKSNPYVDYRAAELYAFLSKQGVAKPANTGFVYSNLGFGLLGQALAVRVGKTYPELLKEEITGPLGMKDTVVALSAEQQNRFIQGHDAEHNPTHAWDLDALGGAGAIRSTAGDMLTYLEAQLHPEKLSAAGTKTLPAALAQSHELRADAMPGMRIGFAWLYVSDTGMYWHNGATGGYNSYVFFNPKEDYAAVVLLNTSIGGSASFADLLGQHIAQRLAGKPAISLGL